MLKSLKLLALALARRAGAGALLLRSRWRQQRVLILGYHGISLDDEHQWSPQLYMRADFFRRRLAKLRALGCQVLPLGEALERLAAGQLPPASVALTFDEGFCDFYRQACPLLEEFGLPATVYVSTYYCDYNRPVFDPMVSYLLWKGTGQTLDWREVLGGRVRLEEAVRPAVTRRILTYVLGKRLTGRDKDALLAQLAARLRVDYAALCARRILHLMNTDELRAIAGRGIDLQLHTHRHRAPRKKERFLKEIQDNRARLAAVTPGELAHFCYPGGAYLPEFAGWLGECGVRSATTCEPGLATRSSNPWLLPRVVDTSHTPELVFESWLSGAAGFLPRHRAEIAEGQLLEE